MGALRSTRPPMGPKEGGLRHPSPGLSSAAKRRTCAYSSVRQNARAVNTESFGNLSRPDALRPHLAHLRRVHRGWPAFVDARGLHLGDVLKLPLATQVRLQVADAAGEAVNPRHHEHVALAQEVEHG